MSIEKLRKCIKRTQSFFIFWGLSLHVDCPFPGLLEKADEFEHSSVFEANFNSSAICKTAFWRGLGFECQIVGTKRWLDESSRQDRV